MGYKLGLIAGTAAGYVLGARAGRARYEQIKKQSAKAWNSEPVQKTVTSATETAKTKAADAGEVAKAKAAEAAEAAKSKAAETADAAKAKAASTAEAAKAKVTPSSGGQHREHHSEVATEDRNF